MELEAVTIKSTQSKSILDKLTPQWIGAGVIVIAFLFLLIAINPLHNFPVEDDWDYSRMVRIFVETGQIQRSDYAQATLIFPALYGGLVSKLFGFSFTTLRLSTLLLALVTLLAFYLLLGELKFSIPLRVVGTLALLVTPAFIYLAFSFMTDVPALCWLILAMLFYVRALKRDSWRDAFIGSVCAALMFLTRQTGVFVPLAFGAIILWRMPRRRWLAFLAAGCAPALLVVVLYLLLNRNSTDNWATQNITLGLTVQQMLQPEWWGIFLRRGVQTLMTIGIYLAPLWLALLVGTISQWRAAFTQIFHSRLRVIVYAVLAVVFTLTIARLAERGEWFPYLTDILTRAGLRPYLAYYAWDANALRPDQLPTWSLALLTLVAGAAGLGLVYLALQRVNRTWLRSESSELQFIWLLMLFIAGASLVFATFYERYLLPLIPAAIILLLDAARRAKLSLRAAAVGLVVVALVSWVLMQDYWAWNEARWQVGRELLAQNIPADKIDGGYEWDGWYLYDATVEYIKTTGKPFIYDPWQYVLDPEYALAFEPMKNYSIERTIEFPTLFPNHEFYLLHHE